MEGEDWKPLMEIDQMEIPHAFCLGKFRSRSGTFHPKLILYRL
jgi:hypothetical protein